MAAVELCPNVLHKPDLGPAAGPALQEPPRKVNGTHLPSLKSNGPAADVPEGHLFESADTDQGSASRTSPGELHVAGVIGTLCTSLACMACTVDAGPQTEQLHSALHCFHSLEACRSWLG